MSKILEKRRPPTVEVALDGNPEDWRLDRPMTFHVHANDSDGIVKKIYLFSSGYIRAEVDVPLPAPASWHSRLWTLFAKRDHSVDQTFTVTNLFEISNTIIVMAKDNDGLIGLSEPLKINMHTGREYTGTAYQGNPQSIPGKIIAGHYDEGGWVEQDITAGLRSYHGSMGINPMGALFNGVELKRFLT